MSSWDANGNYNHAMNRTSWYLHQYVFFDPDTNVPYFNNYNYYHNYNGDYEHSKDIYYDYPDGFSLGTQYKKPLYFKAKTFYYPRNQNDLTIETRIQCLECKNIDSVKQSLDINGGGDYTCANFGIYKCECKKTILFIFLKNLKVPNGCLIGYIQRIPSHNNSHIMTRCPLKREEPRSIIPALVISAALGIMSGGFAASAGYALVPSIASASSPALMGVNLVAGGAGGVLQTLITGNPGVSGSYSGDKGLQINSIKDTVVNYAASKAYYYINGLDDEHTQKIYLCRNIKSLTERD
jgi:hypothetical protein